MYSSRPGWGAINRIIGALLMAGMVIPAAGCTIVVGGGPSQELLQARSTGTHTATPTATATDVIMIAHSATPTSTRTPTVTETPTPTETGTPTPTGTPTATPTFTGTPTETGTATSTGTATPTTVVPTATQVPTATSTRRTPTSTSVPYDSSEVQEPTTTPTATNTDESTKTPTLEATQPPTLTVTPVSTVTSTPTATVPLTGGPTSTPTLTSTEVVTPTVTLAATTTVTNTEDSVTAQSTAATPYPVQGDMASSDGPSVSETTITIDTYDYKSALVPSTADDAVYPYPRLNHDLVGPPFPKEYRALVLENRYVALTILPELGGRIYRWVDKTSGRNLFYENPVIKPTGWGYRGWWLATGGMEWALPLDEHGLSEASDWQYTLQRGVGTAGVTVSNTEKRTGLVSSVSIDLDTDHNYFALSPRITNPTAASIQYKFWINGMFSLGSQLSLASIDFVLPASLVTVHSTSDRTLPAERETMDWPVYRGRDLSKYANWTNYMGVFASPAASDGFMGAYNHYTNVGVVRVFPYQQVPGAKLFGMGELDPSLWTDDNSSYFELWGGLAPTFWDQVTLGAGETVSWQEWWYALGDVGGFRFANTEAALNLGTTVNSAQVAAASTHSINGQLVLWQGEEPKEAMRWPIWLAPDRPFRGSFIPETGSAGPFGLSLYDENGRMVAAIGKVGNIYDVTAATGSSGAGALGSPDEVVILDVNGDKRDWDWVGDEFGYELLRAPALSTDGRAFRLVKLQEVVGSPLYVVEEQNERGKGTSKYHVAFYWHDAPKDISGFTNQKWHGYTRAMYGYPTPRGEWGIRLGKDSLKEPGEGECATFVLSADVPSDVLAKISPVAGTDYRTLRPTFRLVSSGTSAAGTGQSSSMGDEDTFSWDSRLDTLGITLIRGTPKKGKPHFELISARFQDEEESAGFHHILVEVLDEEGERIVGQKVILAWDDGQATMVTEDKDPPEYAANVPMYAEGRYRVFVDGGTSDVVDGMRLPGKRHVSYLLTYQRTEDK